MEGSTEGVTLGSVDGVIDEGIWLGLIEGSKEGSNDGDILGVLDDGEADGTIVEGSDEGIDDGDSECIMPRQESCQITFDES